ncbi:hypothetical protein [Treponema endosymbiont of Eucomonympha sp.]|uniref:hypothetical protein n=1 Tax=Treponema endosymbiont of Eucomonympha sp. TaxID=1580831 RepID=UPI000751988A|nr:hypothetical protein [Treponema endosymbiont of Eucomonympha sp.]
MFAQKLFATAFLRLFSARARIPNMRFLAPRGTAESGRYAASMIEARFRIIGTGEYITCKKAYASKQKRPDITETGNDY